MESRRQYLPTRGAIQFYGRPSNFMGSLWLPRILWGDDEKTMGMHADAGPTHQNIAPSTREQHLLWNRLLTYPRPPLFLCFPARFYPGWGRLDRNYSGPPCPINYMAMRGRIEAVCPQRFRPYNSNGSRANPALRIVKGRGAPTTYSWVGPPQHDPEEGGVGGM